jgi:hypothetical protein
MSSHRNKSFRKIVALCFIFSVTLFKVFSLLNPAAAYCSALGYKYTIRNTPQGQVGICILPNGEEVNAWDFFYGKVALNYCTINQKTLNP